jgi:large subunit ribosomal protein L4
MPRDYTFSLPEKMRREALRVALSLKQKEGKLILIEDFPLDGFKTKHVQDVLKRFQVKNCLIVTDEKRALLERSARNLPNVKVLRFEGLNVMDVLKHDHLILLRQAVPRLQGVLL